MSELPCPICGRPPELKWVRYTGVGSAWNGSELNYYILRCKPFLRKTHLSTKEKSVATRDAWYRWREDLSEEWNKLVEKEQ